MSVEALELFVEFRVIRLELHRVFEETLGHNGKEFGRTGGSVQIDYRGTPILRSLQEMLILRPQDAGPLGVKGAFCEKRCSVRHASVFHVELMSEFMQYNIVPIIKILNMV